ncbi:MAG: hypothetical protein RPS47_07385 [Colwellia sp.]
MVSETKFHPKIVLLLLILLAVVAVYFLQPITNFISSTDTSVNLDNHLSNEKLDNKKNREKDFNEKITKHRQWLIENNKDLQSLREATGARRVKDRELDELIQATDKRLGLSVVEFNQKYPGFDKEGQ